MRVHRFILTVSVVLSIIISQQSLAQAHTPDWWQKEIQLNNLDLPDDIHCRGYYLITALRDSGLPINVEFKPVIKGTDIVLAIDPRFSKTDKVWVEVPQKHSWKRITSTSGKAKVADTIIHYASEAGGYRLDFVASLPVLLPGTGGSLSETTELPPLNRRGVALCDVAESYADIFRAKKIGWRFSRPGSGDYGRTLKFDIAFPGGSLKNLLCQLVSALNDVDKSHFHFWVISGMEGQMGIGFGRMPRHRFEGLFPEE